MSPTQSVAADTGFARDFEPLPISQPRQDIDLSRMNTLRELAHALSLVSTAGLTHRHGILDFVFSVGAILDKAHAICLSGKDGDSPAPTWGDWLDQRLINRDRACRYMRVHKHRDLVEDLQGRERTLSRALAVIDATLKGHPIVPRRKTLDVSYNLALDMMSSCGLVFEGAQSPEAVEAFLNWAIDLAGSKKHVQVYTEADEAEEVEGLVTHALHDNGREAGL